MNTPDTNDIDKILHKLTAEAVVRSHGKQPITGPLEAKQEAKAAITNLIAQETNKAVVAELEELMADMSQVLDQPALGDLSLYVDLEINRLTADKEQVPDASIVADKPENYKAGVIGKVEGVELYSINGDSNIMTGQEFYDRFKDEVRQTVHKAQSKDTMYLEQDEVYEAAKRAAGLDEQ